MKFTWRTEWPLWLLLFAMFALAAVTWQTAPDQIPVHWGFGDEPNGYGGKFEGLLLIPIVALGIYLMFLLLPRLDPHRENYAHFAGAYTVLRFSVLTVLAIIYGVIHLSIRGHHPAVGLIAPISVGAMFIAIGSVMGKLRPNWFVGIRTPWTLTSERAWTKTHQLGAKVFPVIGLCLIAASVIHSKAAIIATIVLSAILILGTVAYSYRVWREDPNRLSMGAKPSPR